MKILLAEAVTKVDKLEQSRNNYKNHISSTHTTPNCSQPYKVCQGTLEAHVFWKCPNYSRTNFENLSTTSITNIKPVTEHILLEDDDNFDMFTNTLENLFAHEETQPRKRVRVEDIEDEDDPVRFISTNTPNVTSTTVGLLLVILINSINILLFTCNLFTN